MIKRSFLGLSKPKLEVQPVSPALPPIKEVPTPRQITLMLKKPQGPMAAADTAALAKGDAVRTGQKISLSADSAVYVLSSATGTVSNVSPFTGDFGAAYVAVTIDVDEEEVFDEAFEERMKRPDAAVAREFLLNLPGSPPFAHLFREAAPIDTLCIMGLDPELLSMTRRHCLLHQKHALQRGIEALKNITRVKRIVLAVPPDTDPVFHALGAEIQAVSHAYPETLPALLMRTISGQTVPPGKTCEDLGTTFFSAEAVAALGAALESGRFPAYKVLTVTGKDLTSFLVSARIGTPVKDILNMLGMVTENFDRIVFGGPMTGSAVYSEEQPILADTDAILVQDRRQIPSISQNPCINCGECVRICPARIPVNMLVRYLEAGRYDEAADLYDLHCCIECGLCSFVCVAKIPIFQYIRLGKHELARMHAAEANHA